MKIINEDPKQKGSIKTMKVKGCRGKGNINLISNFTFEVTSAEPIVLF